MASVTSALTLQMAAAVLLLSPLVVHAFPTGSPRSSCDNTVPGHSGGRAQFLGYTLTVSPLTIQPGEVVDLTLRGSPTNNFQGLQLQAITQVQGQAGTYRGSFIGYDNALFGYRSCQNNNERDTITQRNQVDKTVMTFQWRAPADFTGSVIITGPVLKNFGSWQFISSPVITVAEQVVQQPTQAPTQAPTQVPTQAPTQAPVPEVPNNPPVNPPEDPALPDAPEESTSMEDGEESVSSESLSDSMSMSSEEMDPPMNTGNEANQGMAAPLTQQRWKRWLLKRQRK